METLSLIFNLLLMILGFGLLIFFHELGHFVAAKWAGIRTEAFAVGMGPVAVAWRKGVGFALGSTWQRVMERTGKTPPSLTENELKQYGIGETEYSLRWLPIGGFVKMLGQEDANPNAVSNDPRSYTSCPVGKRMIVVSAGVIMNLILAAVLFVIAFMWGVSFEAPVVGQTSPTLPAGVTMPENAGALGITAPGLQPGDRVTHINDKPAETFADLQIASAMGRPDVPVVLTVQREGVAEPIVFRLTPQREDSTGLLSLGISPASSNRLYDRSAAPVLKMLFERSGLAEQGVTAGMSMIEVAGQSITTFEQFHRAARASHGQPIHTVWAQVDDRGNVAGERITALIDVKPTYQVLRDPDAGPTAIQNFEEGLFGLVPLVQIEDVSSGANRDILQRGDVVLRIGDRHAPRMAEFREFIASHPLGPVDMVVLRGGEEVTLTARIEARGTFKRTGILGVSPGYAWGTPIIASPMNRVLTSSGTDRLQPLQSALTPIANLQLLPGTRIESIESETISDWRDLRNALRAFTERAHEYEAPADLTVSIIHPTRGKDRETLTLSLRADDVRSLHALSWTATLDAFMFEPVMTTRSAGGNPITAIRMGIEETHKLVVMTYLTIDRLFRRTVGVDQLRGPIGIVHIGAVVAERGFIYLILLLGMISVNLAVINFLPLPIVDGGLFLFLIYEKFKGRPPSIAFQNAVTVIGLFLIGTLFIVVTYNDIARLLM